MIKKNWFLLIFALVLTIGFVFAGSSGGDMHVMGIGADITFPDGSYSNSINYFTWTDSSTEIIIHNCAYMLNGTFYDMSNCNPGNVNFPSTLWDGNYLVKLYYNFSYNTDPSTYYFYVVATSSFSIQTAPPEVTIINPTNDSDYGNNITEISYTINAGADLDKCWFTNGLVTDYSIPCSNGVHLFSFDSIESDNIWQICVKDVVGRENCSSVTFWVDSIMPTIQFNAATTESGNYSQNWVAAEVSASDTNLQTITTNLYDSTGALINSATSPSSPASVNFAGLADGVYYLNATAQDTIGHSSSTETRTIVLDTAAPIITLNSPDNNKPFAQGSDVTIDFGVVENNLKSCVLNLNGAPQTIVPTTYVLTGLSGENIWSISCEDYAGNTATSDSRTFTVLSNLTFPDGTDYTNLTNELNISSVYFWIRNGNGSIYWTDPIDMSRGANWAEYISLEFNKASVDTTTTGAYEFKDKKANITLYNISWNSPQILRDSEICSSDICTELLGSYVANVSYMFNVSSFSTYETRETPVPSYGVSGGGTCKTNWTCTAWSTCFGNMQTRTCTKVKLFCNVYTDKPAEEQSCIEQKSANTTQIQEAPEQQETANNQPQGGTGITGFVAAHPASTAATLIAILGVASYFVVSRIRAKSLNPEPAKTGGKEGVSWITSKSTEKVDSI